VAARFSETWIQGVDCFLRRWTHADDRLLVAVSGGADSVGLLAVLTEELGYDGGCLTVGHVNHGIRPEAGDDAKFVRDFAEARGLECLIETVDALGEARRERMSLEAAARRLRYAALRKMASERGCRWMVTAHTRDDSAETVLLRLLSGAPWYECTGIPARNHGLLRPLIGVTRSSLRDWVECRRLPYREDATNADPRYLRSRLRNVLLQKQEFWSENRSGKLAQVGQLLWWAMEAYRSLARETATETSSGSGVFGLEIERILGYYKGLAFVPMEVAWAQTAGRPEARLPSAVRREIPPFVRGKSPQARLMLPEGVIAHRRGGRVWLYRASAPEVDVRVGLGEHWIAERSARLSLSLDAPDDGSHGAAIDSRCLERELRLRSWRPGDRIRSAGRPTKKVADLLAERRLDPHARAQVLVLADESGPLLMIGGPVAERALPPPGVAPLYVFWKTNHGT
jgi:tRNA(Ile)-lysidine synthase